MEKEEWLKMGLDPEVIPLVKFFNDNGLPTYMSCQGHNLPNMSIFWIEFDKSVTENDILDFMKKHLQKNGSFFSCGRFAKRIIGFHKALSGIWSKEESWNYFAANVGAANTDLQQWMSDTDEWKGIDGVGFKELSRTCMKG